MNSDLPRPEWVESPKSVPLEMYEVRVKMYEELAACHRAKIKRRNRAIFALSCACVLVALYFVSASGCFLGRWPIIIKGGGHGGGDGSTVEGGK